MPETENEFSPIANLTLPPDKFKLELTLLSATHKGFLVFCHLFSGQRLGSKTRTSVTSRVWPPWKSTKLASPPTILLCKDLLVNMSVPYYISLSIMYHIHVICCVHALYDLASVTNDRFRCDLDDVKLINYLFLMFNDRLVCGDNF